MKKAGHIRPFSLSINVKLAVPDSAHVGSWGGWRCSH
nr:MAG TPA: hypothetical protein [Bacteriophage sp.]